MDKIHENIFLTKISVVWARCVALWQPLHAAKRSKQERIKEKGILNGINTGMIPFFFKKTWTNFKWTIAFP